MGLGMVSSCLLFSIAFGLGLAHIGPVPVRLTFLPILGPWMDFIGENVRVGAAEFPSLHGGVGL